MLLGVQLEILGDRGDQPQGVRAVVDGEGALEPGRRGVAAQDPHAGAVEGGDPHAACDGAHQLAHPLPHLGGGLVGEGDREDLPGQRLPAVQQMGDAAGEHAGLAGAGTRDDQQRAAAVLDGLALGRVQALDEFDEARCVRAGPGVLPGRRPRWALRRVRDPGHLGRGLGDVLRLRRRGVVIGRFLVVRRFLVHAGFRAERRCRRSGGLLDGWRRGALRVRLVTGGRGDRDPVEAAEGVGQRKVVEERAHEGSRIGRGPDSAQAAGSRGDGPSVGRSRRGGGAVPGRRKAGAPAPCGAGGLRRAWPRRRSPRSRRARRTTPATGSRGPSSARCSPAPARRAPPGA